MAVPRPRDAVRAVAPGAEPQSQALGSLSWALDEESAGLVAEVVSSV